MAEIEYKYPIWRRFVACVVDGTITSVIFIVFLIPLYLFDSLSLSLFSGVETFWDLLSPLLVLGFLAVPLYYLYYVLFEASRHRGTLGKIWLGIELVDSSGSSVSWWVSFWRVFLPTVPGNILALLWLTGLVSLSLKSAIISVILIMLFVFCSDMTVFFTSRRRTLWDILFGTCVRLVRVEESLELGFEYSTPRRIIAGIIDMVFVFVLLFATFMFTILTEFTSLFLSLSIFAIFVLLYYVLFELIFRGTLGKLLLGVRLVDKSGFSVSWWVSSGRFLVPVILWVFVLLVEYYLWNDDQSIAGILLVSNFSNLVSTFLLGSYLTVFFSRTRRTLWDMLFGTYVIRRVKEDKESVSDMSDSPTTA